MYSPIWPYMGDDVVVFLFMCLGMMILVRTWFYLSEHSYIWVNYVATEPCSSPGIMVFNRDIIPLYGRAIQVTEI